MSSSRESSPRRDNDPVHGSPPQRPSHFYSPHSSPSRLPGTPQSPPAAAAAAAAAAAVASRGLRSPSPLRAPGSPIPLRSPSPLAHLNLLDDSAWSPQVPHAHAKDLPMLPDRYTFSWPNSHKPVDPNVHTVWLFDNTAFRLEKASDGSWDKEPHQKSEHAFIDPVVQASKPPPGPCWQAEYVVAYFGEKLEHDPVKVAKSVLKKLGLGEDDTALETIKRRLEPFVTPVLPRGTIRVNIDNIEMQTLGPASRYGISSSVNRFHFNAPTEHQVTTTSAIPNTPANFLMTSNTVLAEPTGWGIISDIDDTIKVTMTASVAGILKTTFVDEATPITGMPELYAKMHTRLSAPAWFYVSASPYNLYPFLRDFRSKYYPPGTLILRDASWENLGGLISSLMVQVQQYKVNRIMKIHGWFPKRRFICIGDSTQKDPETYGEVCRLFPGWVKAVFIRRVTDVGLDEEKNADERFEKAFEGVKDVDWYVFEGPEEVERAVERMVGAPAGGDGLPVGKADAGALSGDGAGDDRGCAGKGAGADTGAGAGAGADAGARASE